MTRKVGGEEASKGQAGQHVCTPRAHFYTAVHTFGVQPGLKIVRMCRLGSTHVGTPLLPGGKQPWQDLRRASQPLLSPKLHLAPLPNPFYKILQALHVFSDHFIRPFLLDV